MDFYVETSSDESLIQKKKFICIYCNKSFAKNSKLIYHIRRHTGERPFACQEPNCNKTYLYSSHLRRHKDLHHSIIDQIKSEPIPCSFEGCTKIFANKYSLKKHVKLKHDPNKLSPFQCSICDITFDRKQNLIQHTFVHTGVMPFKCVICDMGFLRMRDCNRHKRTHTVYTCQCGTSFERWTNLLSHRKICEIATPRCNICNKSFKQKRNLPKHLASHMQKGDNMFICGYQDCSRFYKYKNNLIYHINTFHKKIPLPRILCTEPGCTKSFSRRQNLNFHVNRVHLNKNENLLKKPRKPRKDKGVKKKSVAAILSGLNHSYATQIAAMEGYTTFQDEPSCSSKLLSGEEIFIKEEVVSEEEVTLQRSASRNSAVLSSCANEMKSSDTDDNENSRQYTKVVC